MNTKSCTICAGKLVYGNPEKKCFRCNDTGEVPEQWEEPKDPPFDVIQKVALEMGYAVAVHGSQMRDFDIIAVPWTFEAQGCRNLLTALCNVLNAKILSRESKPHGRYAFNLQINGYYKVIDISVAPTMKDSPMFPYLVKKVEHGID